MYSQEFAKYILNFLKASDIKVMSEKECLQLVSTLLHTVDQNTIKRVSDLVYLELSRY